MVVVVMLMVIFFPFWPFFSFFGLHELFLIEKSLEIAACWAA